MQISKETFFAVAQKLGMPKEQSEFFWINLEKTENPTNATLFSQFLYYSGALIVISAMTWFMNLGWEWFGGGGLFFIALAYGVTFLVAGASLWRKREYRIPGGLLVTMAVCMVPLAIFGLENYWEIWPLENPGHYQEYYSLIHGSWIYIEIGTIIAGLIAIWFFPFTFMTAPIFLAAWFLTMDMIAFFLGKEISWETRSWIGLCLGFILIAIGYLIDRIKKEDFAFWSYLFGTITFSISLGSLMWGKGEGVLFGYCLINAFMMCLSVLLKRKVLMVFGAIGVGGYLCHLAYNVFQDSLWFPFILSLIGLAVIYLGIWFQKNSLWIENKLLEIIPSPIRKWLP